MSCRGGVELQKNVSSGDSLRIDISVIISGGDGGTCFFNQCVWEGKKMKPHM